MTERTALPAQTHTKASALNHAGILQRKCACGQHTVAGGECAECRKKQHQLQHRTQSATQTAEVPAIVNEALHTSGQPLSDNIRSLMESRFGHDFSQVRVHPQTSRAFFPHQLQIERALGVPIPGKAVVAPTACARRGVPAFTEYATSYFASRQPDLKVAAHEATHLVQHSGRTHDANLGAEGHAATVASHIAMGRSARPLLGRGGAAVIPAYRPYTEISEPTQTPTSWNAGMDLRASEDGRMAVGQDSTMHNFWAESAKITESNSILARRRSVIRLDTPGGIVSGAAPDGSGTRTLSKVLPRNVANTTSGESMNIWADCGKSGRDVMGAGGGTGGGYDDMTAVYQQQKRPWWVSIPILGPLLGWIFGQPKPQQQETATSAPEEMKKEILNERLGGSGDEGLNKYMALSPTEQDQLDRELGINRYAAPTAGEGYTTSTGGSPVPGNRTWNFHWGGVVMTSGEDRVTLENYAVGDPAVQNSDWEFQMYGSAAKPGQTFHEQHKATGQHGDAPTTMRVRKS